VTAANIAFIAKTGSLQLGSTALQVTEYVVAGIVVAVVAGVLFWQFTAWGRRWVARFTAAHEADPCPCCTLGGRDYDCTCREDCGVRWCQAADPEACPWCDTHACIDRTMCNCAAACGSWLCEAKEAADA